MTVFLLGLHLLYTVNILLLVIGVLLIRDAWQPIGNVLSDLTRIRMPWMHAVLGLTLLFLFIGLIVVARDIRGIMAGTFPVATRFGTTGLVVVLIILNVSVIPIITKVGIMGYVPVVTQMCKAVIRPEAEYTLPDALRLSDGNKVTDSATWTEKRRPEILALFENEIYGRIPERRLSMKTILGVTESHALNGKAMRKQVDLRFENAGKYVDLNVLVYLPAKRVRPVPVFVGLNFYGNHTIHTDPGIPLTNREVDYHRAYSTFDDRKIAETRGSRATHWPVERILERGYGLVTACYNDIDPDFDDDFQNGIHSLFSPKPQQRRAPDEWGSISAWAWGLSRIMDYIEMDADIDSMRVAVMGHSRLGKTALWAGARDKRFAIVVSNDSGCMGAALARRRYGETISDITSKFPHWFCGNFQKYAGHENDLPVDQHMLIALIAPRPVYVASANMDLWADPEGEFLAARAASEVYRLFGMAGLPVDTQPDLHKPVMGRIGYHIRQGKHWVTSYDWDCFLDFADFHFRTK